MADKLIDDFDEIIPTGSEFALVSQGAGVYKKARVSNFSSGGIPQLVAPVLSALVVNSSTQITASWTNVANENGYEIQRSTDNVNWGNAITVPANDITEAITGLTASTLYYVRVRALGDNVSYSNSPWSNVQSATTQAGASFLHRSLFTGTNGTNLTAYTPDNGSAWTAFADVWEIQSNRAVPKTPFAANNPVYLTDTGATQNYTLTSVFSFGGVNANTQLQFWARCDAAISKGIAVAIKDTDVRIVDVAAGGTTLGLTTISALGTTDHTVEVILSGATVTVKIDGATVINAQAINAGNNGTKCGIGQAGGVAVVDSDIDSFIVV